MPAAGLAVVNGDDVLTRVLITQLDNQLAAPIKTFAASMAQDVQVTWDGTRRTLPPHIDEIIWPNRRGLSDVWSGEQERYGVSFQSLGEPSASHYFVPSPDD